MSIENRFEWSDGSGTVSATGAGDSFSAWSEGEPNAWGPPGSEGDGGPGHPESVEDAIQLFGFGTTDEKRVFEKLLSVSGVGPKLALSVLSTR